PPLEAKNAALSAFPLREALSLLADVREQTPCALQFLALAGHEQPTSHTTQANFGSREPRCHSVLLPVIGRPGNYIESSVSDDADGRDSNPRCGKTCRRTSQARHETGTLGLCRYRRCLHESTVISPRTWPRTPGSSSSISFPRSRLIFG